MEGLMKLAEALILRADYQKKIYELKTRIENSVKIQEGEEAQENPQALLKELADVLNQQEHIVKRINRTNVSVIVAKEESLADLIISRDLMKKKRNILSAIMQEAVIKQDRYSRTEVKFVNTIKISDLQKEIDGVSKLYRELDVKIQEKNWTVELL
ncbi:MAG: DIP1984 family protein [Cellulosilyticaceae bacterium]